MPQSRLDKRRKAALAHTKRADAAWKRLISLPDNSGDQTIVRERVRCVRVQSRNEIDAENTLRNIERLGNRSRRGSSYRRPGRSKKSKTVDGLSMAPVSNDKVVDLLKELRQAELEHDRNRSRR